MLLQLTFTSLAPVLVIPIIFMVIVYIFGKATQNNSLLSLSKSELIEYILFLVLFVAITSFIFSDYANNLLGYIANYVYDNVKSSNSVVNKPYTPPANKGEARDQLITATNNALDDNFQIVNSIMSEHNKYLQDLNVIASVSQSVSFLSSMDVKSIKGEKLQEMAKKNPAADTSASFSSCIGYNAAAKSMGGFSNYVAMSLMALKFQELLIQILSSDSAVSALLAIGILLRSNPITRNAGAFFLALGIGLYSILPFSVLISNYVVYVHYKDIGIDSSISSLYSKWEGILGYNQDGIKIHYTYFSDCNPNKIQLYLNHLSSVVKGDNAKKISSFLFLVSLAQGITLLTFVSIVGGISKAFGAEISPYIIGRLTTYLSGR